MTTIDDYLQSLPKDRRESIQQLINLFRAHLPEGFEETISYGMIAWVVPHSLYPAGYHCDPKQPLPFISIASQKQHISVHHMGLYANPVLLAWFQTEYAKQVKTKLNMGKGCVRFRNPNVIPMQLLADLAHKMTVADWIECYQTRVRP